MADQASNQNVSDKDWTTILIVAIFLGGLGVHRFMAGKIGTGLLMALTGGCCGVLYVIDIVNIVTGKFTDAEGRLIVQKK